MDISFYEHPVWFFSESGIFCVLCDNHSHFKKWWYSFTGRI